MSDLFKLQREVSETTANINPDDVFNVKKYLKNLGYYQEPEWGMTKFTDNQMFGGIRKFQKDNHLKVDGVMKPEGETENAFNKLLRKGGYLFHRPCRVFLWGGLMKLKGLPGLSAMV